MPRDQRYSFSFPRFRASGVSIIVINVIVFFLAISVGRLTAVGQAIFDAIQLTPSAFFHGRVWQLLTYGFVDFSILSILFSSIMLYWYSSMFENRRFLEVYFAALLGGGLLGSAYTYTGFLRASPDHAIFSPWAGVFGLVAVWGVLFKNQEVYMFPLMFPIKAKIIALVLIGIQLAVLFLSGSPLAATTLAGALVGYIHIKMLPRRGLKYAASEQYFGVRNKIRNAYYRWKRRRATRKFEVYMRKHDRTVYFDQYGNYIHPEEQSDKGKDESGSGGWVN